jgi:hypothetical protein
MSLRLSRRVVLIRADMPAIMPAVLSPSPQARAMGAIA